MPLSLYTARIKLMPFPGMGRGTQPHINEDSILQSQARHLSTLISARIRCIIPTEVNWDVPLVNEVARIHGSVSILLGGSAVADRRGVSSLSFAGTASSLPS